jgi:hypothetical protein
MGADRPMPHYRPAPEYPPLPGRLPPATNPPMSDYPISDYQPVAGRPVVADWPPAPDYPAVPRYLSVRDRRPVPDWPAAPADGYRAPLRRLARLLPRYPAAGGPAGRRAALLGYLAVPVFGAPVVIYLATLRGPSWARRHTAQAVNVWFTGLLYDLSAVIMGAMLALDSPSVALTVFAPLVAARWLVTLAYLVRAARAAGRGAAYIFPAWLSVRLAR